MKVLVTWSSKHGGTEGIGKTVADEIHAQGFEVVALPVDEVTQLSTFDAVIIGGALYANRWPAHARRFVRRNVRQLRKVPVWFFSSGPLDDSADREEIPPPPEVAVLTQLVGAKGHVTFGGRLEPDVKGFPASAMAKKSSGDWRNLERIRAWGRQLAGQIPTATPGEAIDQPGGSLGRMLIYGLTGWALCTATMFVTLSLVSLTPSLVVHAIAAPLYFVLLSVLYFRPPGAREPLLTAVIWTATVAFLDLVIVAGLIQRSVEMFGSIAGTWLPFALIFAATWLTGTMMSMMPLPSPEERAKTTA
jgi:menaquinone-dependent protoporphyrinogen oxidase